MTGKVIQGSFLASRPGLSVQPKIVPPPNRMMPPPASPKITPPPVPARTVPRLPGPPAPAFVPPRPVAVQRHGAGGAFAVEAGSLGLTASGGRPLPEAVRGKMEAALGADFSAVRVYVGPQAERIGAIAFTVGTDIYFAPGRYQPDTMQGQQLLGHELAHVVQQRAGRVRNPLGAGLAVVQDRALEAEADRLGQRAAMHRVTVQPKRRQSAVNSSSPVRISQPITAGPGRYRLSAGTGGREIGSVMVHARDRGALEVTDLGVDAAQRGNGIGQMLVAAAARTGMQSGRSKVTLAAQDRGSGHLTRWYKEMGFTQTGVNRHGFPQLEAPISRLLSGTAQRTSEPPKASVLRDNRLIAAPAQLMPSKIELMPPANQALRLVQRVCGPNDMALGAGNNYPSRPSTATRFVPFVTPIQQKNYHHDMLPVSGQRPLLYTTALVPSQSWSPLNSGCLIQRRALVIQPSYWDYAGYFTDFLSFASATAQVVSAIALAAGAAGWGWLAPLVIPLVAGLVTDILKTEAKEQGQDDKLKQKTGRLAAYTPSITKFVTSVTLAVIGVAKALNPSTGLTVTIAILTTVIQIVLEAVRVYGVDRETLYEVVYKAAKKCLPQSGENAALLPDRA